MHFENSDPYGINTKIFSFMEQAFSYVGFSPEKIEVEDTNRAYQALNKIQKDWINPFFLQFNEVLLPVKLINNISWYPLPPEVYNVYNVTLRAAIRYAKDPIFLESSPGGDPTLAFDNNIYSICQQTDKNGHITIAFASEVLVNAFGVLSAKTEFYNLELHGSNTGNSTDWVKLYSTDHGLKFEGSPTVMNTRWFTLNVPQYFKYYRLQETGGKTLSIREFYLEKFNYSRTIGDIGRATYMNITVPGLVGGVSTYSLQKTNTNINVQLWGAPTNVSEDEESGNSNNYNFLFLRGVKFPFTFGSLYEPINLNPRFHSTLVDWLAMELSYFYDPSKTQALTAKAEASFKRAKMQDNDLGGLVFTM